MKAKSEAGFQATFDRMAALFHWRTYHTRDSRGSAEGFPDVLAIHRDGRMFVAELKSLTGRETPVQQAWREAFLRAGVSAYLWDAGCWDEIERVLRGEG